MDRMLYIAMTGASQVTRAQAVNSNNLANVSTNGFRADLEAFRSLPLNGPGHNSRVYTVDEGQGVDFTSGSLQTTGRSLDVAIKGQGWIAVQAADGSHAYTRAGNLQVSEVGQLLTGAGHPVIGADGGPVALPPFEKLDIGDDGTISLRALGQEASTIANVNRIQLVNPDTDKMYKGRDGLMRVEEGTPVIPDANVTLVNGMLEGSNVNAVESLVNMITLARQFEMQVKMMSTAQENDAASAQLMRIN
ncbi:flagellar basal-body rod protein FlgF [Sulfuriflexus sp.]|uniref:flagellar basal-body rod protein FlgF n=1 Tax=Sulfuriflexus sp. TaxID=2015443 RepID=UPI0028CD2EE3|nr:flagellar basal-body rod protein FlgF [Sulfuriflexus sp.]MDT8404488.1 flagellar basal-body rod protein FlgF [Sulfuriflexus sp.]